VTTHLARVTTAATLLAILTVVPGEAQSFLSKQPARLTLAVDAPMKPVAIGAPFAITVRVTPLPGIHVYAPGNPNYIPVAITVTPVAGLKVSPPVFPAGEDLFFGPLKETVKVYSAPFAIRLPLLLEPRFRKGKISMTEDLALRGTVSYQACNDRVCFPPQSAPFDARLPVRLERP
jgi:DsbC/DsbD-like thiol-disulfide interchange protein